LFQEKGCSVIVDQYRLCEGVDLQHAVNVAFAAYYVLNVQYPEESANTLEFIQRLVNITCENQ
jgi:hypothetical protein